MKALKKGCVTKLAVKRDPFYKQIAGGPRSRLPKYAWKSVKAKKAAFGTPHLPTMGTEVTRMRQNLESSYGCCHGDQMLYMCICAFKHLISHELILNSNSIIASNFCSSFV